MTYCEEHKGYHGGPCGGNAIECSSDGCSVAAVAILTIRSHDDGKLGWAQVPVCQFHLTKLSRMAKGLDLYYNTVTKSDIVNDHSEESLRLLKKSFRNMGKEAAKRHHERILEILSEEGESK